MGVGDVRPGLADAIGRGELVGVGVTQGVEPLATPAGVLPAFSEQALGVVAVEEVLGPSAVIQAVGILGVGDVCLATVVELDLVSGPALRAGNGKHVEGSWNCQ
jgi:hypothetical protein